MVEVQCPFCDEPSQIEASVLAAPTCSLRCDGCGVEVEVVDDAAGMISLAA